MSSSGWPSPWRPNSSRLLTTPSLLAPMSTRISSLSMRTTWPSTTSPCLKLLMSESCSASSSSMVVGSGPSSRAGAGLRLLVVARGRRVRRVVGGQRALGAVGAGGLGGGRVGGSGPRRRALVGGGRRRLPPRASAARRRTPVRRPRPLRALRLASAPRRRPLGFGVRLGVDLRWRRPRSARLRRRFGLLGRCDGVVGAGGGLVGDGDRRGGLLGRLVGGGDRLRLRRGPALLLFGQGSGHSWLWICSRESRTA